MSDKKLEEMALEERREYFRQWRAANKDKVKKHNQEYWRRRAEKKAQEADEQREPEAN